MYFDSPTHTHFFFLLICGSKLTMRLVWVIPQERQAPRGPGRPRACSRRWLGPGQGLCWAPGPGPWGQWGPVLGPHRWAHSQVALRSVLKIVLTQENYTQLPSVRAWCWCSSGATAAPPLPVITHWCSWSGVCWPWDFGGLLAMGFLGSAEVLHQRGVKSPVRYRNKTTFSCLFTQPIHISQL